jgi:hypothetical protein
MKFNTLRGIKDVVEVSREFMLKKFGSSTYRIYETDKNLYVTKEAIIFEMEGCKLSKADALVDICRKYRTNTYAGNLESAWESISRSKLDKNNW